MRAGRAIKGGQEIGFPKLATTLEAALSGIQKQGEAQVGDKTVLDALRPKAAALRGDAIAGLPLHEAPRQALEADAGVRPPLPSDRKLGGPPGSLIGRLAAGTLGLLRSTGCASRRWRI